uniref:Uncharacterized protein n=1 Tax=Anguilla anguilla TaxID=7936 RepID=A0A0E9PDW0_ANGAN
MSFARRRRSAVSAAGSLRFR